MCPARKEPDDPDLSLLEQRKIEARVLIPVIQAFEKRFGKEPTHAIVREVIQSIARKSGEEFGKVSGPHPLDKIRELLPVFSGDGALDVEVVGDSDESYDFDVVRCRFAEFYREMEVPELGFLLSCNRDRALTQGVSPDLELERTKTIMEGDSLCDFRFRLRKREDRVDGESETSSADESERSG